MIAAVVFILFFVVVGLTVLFFAFGGGPKETAQSVARGGGSSKASRRVTYTAVTALVALFGVAIPVLVLIDNNHSESKRATGGLKLTSTEEHGRHLFARNCATCHTLDAANAVGKVGPNLDHLRPPAALVTNAIKLGRARGNGQMPAGLLTGDDVKEVATFVSSAAGR